VDLFRRPKWFLEFFIEEWWALVKTTISAIEFSAKEHTVGVTFQVLLHQIFDCQTIDY